MRIRVLTWLVGATLAIASLAGPVSADTPQNIVGIWNRHAANALINPATAAIPGAGQPPGVAVIHLAMVQGAVYDAVNGIAGGYEPYVDGLTQPSSTASQAAAVATAAHARSRRTRSLVAGSDARLASNRAYAVSMSAGATRSQAVSVVPRSPRPRRARRFAVPDWAGLAAGSLPCLPVSRRVEQPTNRR